MGLMSTCLITLQGIVASRSDATWMLPNPGDAVVVDRGRPRVLILNCPCGCKEVFALNVDRSAGKAWRLYLNQSRLTVYPSIWRDTGCLSHFIISRGTAYVFGGEEDEEQSALIGRPSPSLDQESVRRHLIGGQPRSVEFLADRLQALPWDVLTICRQLVRQGEAFEGTAAEKGSFGLRKR
jgi:hypothetical protein